MKTFIQHLLIRTLGFKKYLTLVAYSRILTFRLNKEQADLRYFVSLIPDTSGLILDIGANIGVVTWYLATQKKKSDIYSFEPIPDNFTALEDLVQRNKLKNVTPYRLGLGSISLSLEMIMPIINGVKRHALCQVYQKDTSYKEGVRFQVQISTLDSLEQLKIWEGRILAIKIDVEEFEYEVFQGGIELIRHNRPLIFCEFWDSNNKQKIIDLFASLDYEVKIYDQGSLYYYHEKPISKGNFFLLPRATSSATKL